MKKTKGRRRAVKASSINPMTVLLASDREPVPIDERIKAVMAAQDAINAITTEDDAHIAHWMALCDVINIMETMVVIGKADDEHGLIKASGAAIKDAIERKRTLGAARFDGPGLQAVRAALSSWPELLGQMTHRDYMRAIYETDVRLRMRQRNPAKDDVNLGEIA